MAFQKDKLEYLHRSTEGGTSLASYTPDGDAFTTGASGTPTDNLTSGGYWDAADIPLNGLIVFVVARTSTISTGTTLQQATIRVNRLRQADPDSSDPDSTRVATLTTAANLIAT